MADKKKTDLGSVVGDSLTGGHLTPKIGITGGKTASLTGGHLTPKGIGGKPGGNSSSGQGSPKTKP